MLYALQQAHQGKQQNENCVIQWYYKLPFYISISNKRYITLKSLHFELQKMCYCLHMQM